MARMTEEEAWALSDYFTNNEYTIGPNGSDWLSQRELRISGLQNMTIQYLLTKAKNANKSPVQIIDELVAKELAIAV
ncbi:MAG: hypothetical protein FWD26_08870 [Treponema sp.]|nr:hypothetical protein [Treponema sp.]